MALETVTHISDLDAANPLGSDPRSEGDNHIRNVKSALLTDFPGITGVVLATHTELNILDGVTSTTAELNILDGVTSTTAELNILDGVTSTAAELNLVDGITAGTVLASKAVIVDSSKKVNEWLVDNITIDGNSIVSTDTAGDINITPDTTGDLVLDGLKWPQADGTSGQYLKTDGAAQTSWVTGSPAASVLTTHGDILFQDSGPANARLAAGTAGQWLQTEGNAADPVWSNTWKLAVVGGDQTLSRVNLLDYGEVTNAIGSTGGGTQDIDLTLGNSVTATVDTSTNTFTFSNPTASDELSGFSLMLTNGGSQTVNWPASVDWAGGTAPTLTTSGVDCLVFWTVDGGTIWNGAVVALDLS